MRPRTEIEQELTELVMAARQGDEKARMRLALDAQKSKTFAGDTDRALQTKSMPELVSLISTASWRVAAEEAARAIAATGPEPPAAPAPGAEDDPDDPDIPQSEILNLLLGKDLIR